MLHKNNEPQEITPREILKKYLKDNGYRKTPERFFILDEICKTQGHFDIEQLLQNLKKNKKYCVSRATVYNTMEILTQCRLVVRHDFDTARASYECNFNNSHEHVVCLYCGKIEEIQGVPTETADEYAKEKTGFNILSHRLYLYGVCPECMEKRANEQEQSSVNNEEEEDFESNK